jgi:hypothetical protein
MVALIDFSKTIGFRCANGKGSSGHRSVPDPQYEAHPGAGSQRLDLQSPTHRLTHYLKSTPFCCSLRNNRFSHAENAQINLGQTGHD